MTTFVAQTRDSIVALRKSLLCKSKEALAETKRDSYGIPKRLFRNLKEPISHSV